MNTLIIGGGRAARHMNHYFTLLGLRHTGWQNSRELTPELFESLQEYTHILILVSDPAIESIRDQLHSVIFQSAGKLQPVLIHFSGARVIEGVAGAHPLFPFASDLYSEETYRKIPFMIESGGKNHAELNQILPDLPNPSYRLDPTKKALYHALCVASGNFSTLLWQSTFERFIHQLDLPPETLHPYLNQITANLQNNWKGALTGPLTRNDRGTLQNHLRVLEGDPLQKIYQQFIEFHATFPNSEENSHAQRS